MLSWPSLPPRHLPRGPPAAGPPPPPAHSLSPPTPPPAPSGAAAAQPQHLADVPVLSFTDAEQRDAENRPRGLPARFLAVHPGSGSPSKNWHLARVLEAAS